MSTPQSELARLANSIEQLLLLFEADGGDYDIFTRINRIDTATQEISRRMEVLQDQMSLIIKLLSKTNVG
jgi:hypothetical protein